jgi:hypothetical protein
LRDDLSHRPAKVQGPLGLDKQASSPKDDQDIINWETGLRGNTVNFRIWTRDRQTCDRKAI